MLFLSLSALLISCGDDASSVPPDAMITADVPTTSPTLVTIDTVDAPALIAYRMENSATWQSPRTITANKFELAVTGPYRVTVVCTDPDDGMVFLTQLALVPTDKVPVDLLGCFSTLLPFVVNGTMAQPGAVALDYTTKKSTQSNWSFQLPAEAGTYALVARNDDRIAIRRGLRVAGNVTLPDPIDVAAIGTPLEHVGLNVTNLDANETTVTAAVSLEADHTYTSLYRGPLNTVTLAPQSVLTAADKQLLYVNAKADGRRRFIQRPQLASDPTDVTLPPALGQVTFNVTGDQLAATWSTLPPHDVIDISLDSFVNDWNFQMLELSSAFVEATGITTATLDTATLPGLQPSWRIDTTKEYTRELLVTQSASATNVAGSSVSETINAAPKSVLRSTRDGRYVRRWTGPSEFRGQSIP